ncbi:retrovirus-related Pol polyprotein from transposon 297 [Trichonephila clavipes]|nr:retrovirus-related Pol polyprotein from transposon 297 [Trichonephila clavipes]
MCFPHYGTSFRRPEQCPEDQLQDAQQPPQNEIKRSTEFLAKIAQLSEFKAEIDALKKGKGVSKTSKLKALHPFLDENSLLRVGGRLSNADLPFEQRNKWQFEKNNFAVGCLVLLKENDLPPCKWAMARILEAIYGTDVHSNIDEAYGLEHFNYYTYGRIVTVQTDHKPILGLSKKTYDTISSRLQRMLLRLNKYNIQLEYVPGKNLVIADALSRAQSTTDNFDEVIGQEAQL